MRARVPLVINLTDRLPIPISVLVARSFESAGRQFVSRGARHGIPQPSDIQA